MRRREVITLLGGAVSWPLAARAQQQSIRRVGSLSLDLRPPSLTSGDYGAFLQRMSELGHVEGKSFVVDWRFADGQFDRLPHLAAELVDLKVDVIVAWTGSPARAAQKITSTIPIVVAVTTDPVATGLATTLARPGANVTGFSITTADFTPKLIELMQAVRPNLARLAVLARPKTVSREIGLASVQNVAQKFGIAVTAVDVEAHVPGELARGFNDMSRERVDAVIIANEPILNAHRRVVAELAIHHRLPAIVPWREYADEGLLMSYGPLRSDFARQAATYVDKILKGAKPNELPIEQPSRLYLIINLKTARSLGLEIPSMLLVRADEVIE